jgi:hypothetical protein
MSDDRYLLEHNPAFLRPDWIPETRLSPELSELREEHLRLLAERTRLFEEVFVLTKKFEAEDEARKEALKEAARTGTAKAKVPPRTPDPEREEALREPSERAEAATAALAEFLREALAAIRERRDQFRRPLEEQLAAADAKREEARRLLAEADAVAGIATRLGDWIDRTATAPSGLHVAWGHLTAPNDAEEPLEVVAARVGLGELSYA